MMMQKRQSLGPLITLTLFLSVAFSQSAIGADTISNYFFRDIAHPNLQQINSQMLKAFDAEDYEEALRLSGDLVKLAEQDTSIDKMSFARALSNASIMNALGGERGSAILTTTRAIELVEDTDPFHFDLFNILMVKSYTQNAEDMHADAEDSLRRAQHITHRQDGVYSRKQLPIIESLAGIKVAQGEFRDADQEQRFNLKVSELAFGSGSEELMPTLERLGNYFANRGSTIPISTVQEDRLYRDRLFREATEMFERSIQIIEDRYGDTDLRLLEPLKGLSRTKYLQGYGRVHAERPMERALKIVQANPATDRADHARALVALGDLYTTTSDNRASDAYMEAWELLGEEEELDDLRYELFGRPVRLVPEAPIQPVLFRHPVDVEEGSELFVDIQYDIREDGRVRNSTVIEGNVPNSDRKLMRDFVSTMRFRPRIKDGELTATEGMLLHQTYRVKNREPKASFNISTGVAP